MVWMGRSARSTPTTIGSRSNALPPPLLITLLERDLCIIPHLRRHFRDSGLVMCVSTLPSPSLSVPCICGILQSPCRKSGAFSVKDHFAKVLEIYFRDPTGGARNEGHIAGATPYRGRIIKVRRRKPGVFGTSCLDHQARHNGPLPGSSAVSSGGADLLGGSLVSPALSDSSDMTVRQAGGLPWRIPGVCCAIRLVRLVRLVR